MIAFSGDVAYSGSADEYTTAIDFIEGIQVGIARRLKLDVVHLVLMPGNHDCQLSPENRARTHMINSLSNAPEDALDPSIIDICTSAQDNYFEFMDLFDSEHLHWDSRLFYRYSFEFEGKKIAFYCLNTAWVSQLHEQEGALYYPVEAITSDPDADVAVSMLHHPYGWFGNENARALRDRLETASDLILTGHEHVGERYHKEAARGSTNEYLEGAALQEGHDPGKSGLSVIEIDLDAKRQRVTHFAWEDTMFRPTAISDKEWAELQVNQLRSQRKFRLNAKFEAYLDDLEATFTTSKGDLSLSDVYVYPLLHEQNVGGNDQAPLRASGLQGRLKQDPRVMIDGPDKAGKTALAKVLYQDLLQMGLTPVMLRGRDQSDHEAQKVRNGIHRAFEAQYDSDVIEEFKQLPSNKKAIILDDFHRVRLNARGRSKLLEELCKHFTYVVVFSDDFALRLEEITRQRGDEILHTFTSFRLLEFGYRLRDEMAMRWLRPDADFVSSPAALAQRIKHVRDVLDTVLGRNFIPSYPFFILSVLQLVESNTMLDTSAASYGYGYFYEALIQGQLERVTTDLDHSTRLTYLSEFAYYLYTSRKREIPEAEMAQVHDRYCTQYKRPLVLEKTLAEFHDALILQRTEQSVRFKYGYYYFYFVASYLRDHITEAEAREDIAHMSAKVYKEEFANILLFLTHLSKDPYIIDQMLAKSRQLYADIEPTDLDGDVAFLNEFHEAVPELVYEDKDPEATRKRLAEQLDKASDLSGEGAFGDDLDEKEEAVPAALLEVNNAYKSIQILGQILKNSPGAIKGERKLEVAHECYGLGRRLLARLYGLISENLDDLVEDMVSRVEEEQPDARQDEIIAGVRRLLFALTQGLGFGMIKWITHAIGSEKLAETYRDLRSEDNSVATALIDTSIKLDHVNTYPLKEIQELAKGLERNFYSLSLLRLLVVYHLDLFYVQREMKQRMCALIGVEYRELASPQALERRA